LAIGLRGVATQTAWSSATPSPTLNFPAGVAQGDLLLAFFTTNSAHNGAASIVSGSWTWTKIVEVDDGGADSTSSLYWAIAPATPGTSFAFTSVFDATETGMGVIVALTGLFGATSIHKFSGIERTVAAAGLATSTATVQTVDNCLIIQFIGSDPGTGAYSSTPDASPVGTETFDAKESTGGSLAYTYIQRYQQTTAASLALDATMATADEYQVIQVAICEQATVYTETGLAIAAAATVTLSDLERYKDLALAVGAVGVVSVADVEHYRQIGLAVPVSALVTAAAAQHFLDTGLPIPVTGTISGSDAKKYAEQGLQITAVGTVAEADLQHFRDAGLAVSAAGTVSLTDALHALDLGLPVTIVGTASVSDKEHYQDLALAVPAAAVLSAAVAQHYQELGLPITAAVTAALTDVEHYKDTALGVSVAAVVSLASEVFHGSYPQEFVALTAVASTAVTDLQHYLEASLPVSAQAVLAAVDKEHYQDAMQVLIAATLGASDAQHWGEALEALATGQVLLTDAQRYKEVGLLVSAVATIGVVDVKRLARLGLPMVIFTTPPVERTFQAPSVPAFDCSSVERVFLAPKAHRTFDAPAVQRVFGG